MPATQIRPAPVGDGRGRLTLRLAKEKAADATVLWRVGAWGGVALAALITAFVVAYSPIAARRHALDAARDTVVAQAAQIRHLTQQSQGEARRLSAALDTLGGDRDRLFKRVTELEYSLDSITGSFAKQAASAPVAMAGPVPVPAPPPAPAAPLASAAPAAETATVSPPKPEVTASMASPPAVETKSAEPPPAGKPLALPKIGDRSPEAVQVTATKPLLGIDLGHANSVEGLRAIWNATRKLHSALVADLQPIVTIREPKDGVGLQLRLVAGPLADAAHASKLCARLAETGRPCEIAAFDGQRLAARESKRASKPPRVEIRPEAQAPPVRPATLSSMLPSFLQ